MCKRVLLRLCLWIQQFTEILLALQLLSFQKAFNGVDIDLRNSPEARAELVLRCDELQDSLWEMCDQRMNDNDAQLHTLMYAFPSISPLMPITAPKPTIPPMPVMLCC